MEENRNQATKTISVVMLLTLLGKVLGLYRDRLLAIHYGTSMASNAFYTASRIPRVFFDAVFASAIAACFIPVFSEYLAKGGKKEAFRFSNSFLTVMTLLTAVLSALGIAFSQPMVELFAAGYDAQTTALAVSLTRIMFPTVLFTGIAFSLVGILQSLGEFNIPALISTVSNGVIILYYFTLNDRFGIYGLAAAFLVGWFLQAAVQLPSLHRLGYRYRPALDWRSEGMRKVFALMVPVMVSTWVAPINLTINSRFGSWLYEGAGVTAIEIANNLYQVIAGVFVLSITNVIFPKLARLTSSGEQGAFRETLSQTTHGCLFFVLPMTAGLMVLSTPLVSFIYGDGAFDAFSVGITAQGLFWVSLGMAGFGVQNILSRAYFARQSSKAPLVAGAVSIAVNLLLCMALTQPLGVAGLAISSSVSSTVYALLLLIPLELRGEGILSPRFLTDLLKMLLCAAVMGAAAWGVLSVTGQLLPGKAGELLSICATTGAGVAVYLLCAALLRLSEAKMILDTAKHLLKRG